MLSLLHICPDDKFIDVAIDIFNSIAQCSNTYVCVKNNSQDFEHIHHSCMRIVSSLDLYQLCSRDIYDVFVFHSLDFSYYKYILALPSNKKVIWLSWGYDLYQALDGFPPIYTIRLYKPLTNEYINPVVQTSFCKKLKKIIKVVVFPIDAYNKRRGLLQQKKKYLDERNRVLEKIDYISTILPYEYLLLKNNKILDAKYFPFQYTSRRRGYIPRLIDFDKTEFILVGNSATATNNHFDIFELCKKRKIKTTLYVPVAYGKESYKEDLKSQAEGMNIFFQEKFIPKEEYEKIMLRCRVCVFGHLRQQAIGNIVMALSQGSKVFLYKDSMAYHYFKEAGYIIYSIEDDFWQSNVDRPMSNEDVVHNIKKIKDWLSVESVIDRVERALRFI